MFGMVEMTKQFGNEAWPLLLLVDAFKESFEFLLEGGKLIREDLGRSVHFLIEEPIVRRGKILQEQVALFV